MSTDWQPIETAPKDREGAMTDAQRREQQRGWEEVVNAARSGRLDGDTWTGVSNETLLWTDAKIRALDAEVSRLTAALARKSDELVAAYDSRDVANALMFPLQAEIEELKAALAEQAQEIETWRHRHGLVHGTVLEKEQEIERLRALVECARQDTETLDAIQDGDKTIREHIADLQQQVTALREALTELKGHADYALDTRGQRTRPALFVPSTAKRVLEIVGAALHREEQPRP